MKTLQAQQNISRPNYPSKQAAAVSFGVPACLHRNCKWHILGCLHIHMHVRTHTRMYARTHSRRVATSGLSAVGLPRWSMDTKL